MTIVKFLPENFEFDVEDNSRILTAARRNKVNIRFGCSACRCGTCAVKVSPSTAFAPMKDAELDLLTRMKLQIDGSVRLSCQARITDTCEVDISFQDQYSPDVGEE
ncbi:MAG: 2Fe-2S iron-sulfur cluster-binding protein [Proteobacteria bacterium]|nr:2Fe-2S iron-sulfur cluster-binding protein [Pseudomonadota bacterium]